MKMIAVFFNTFLFPALSAPILISSIYGAVCTPQNGGDKAQHIATTGSGSENIRPTSIIEWFISRKREHLIDCFMLIIFKDIILDQLQRVNVGLIYMGSKRGNH